MSYLTYALNDVHLIASCVCGYMCVCGCVCLCACLFLFGLVFVCVLCVFSLSVYVCVCVFFFLAVYNKAQAQRISNREFKLWTFLRGTESRVATFLAETCVMSHQSLIFVYLFSLGFIHRNSSCCSSWSFSDIVGLYLKTNILSNSEIRFNC